MLPFGIGPSVVLHQDFRYDDVVAKEWIQDADSCRHDVWLTPCAFQVVSSFLASCRRTTSRCGHIERRAVLGLLSCYLRSSRGHRNIVHIWVCTSRLWNRLCVKSTMPFRWSRASWRCVVVASRCGHIERLIVLGLLLTCYLTFSPRHRNIKYIWICTSSYGTASV